MKSSKINYIMNDSHKIHKSTGHLNLQPRHNNSHLLKTAKKYHQVGQEMCLYTQVQPLLSST